MSNRGFAALPIIIILVIVGVGAAGWFIFRPQSSTTPIVTASPSASPVESSPSATPVVTSKPTAKATVKPTAVPTVAPTASPTPSAAPTDAPKTGCATYDLGGDLGNLTVNIQAGGGQSLVGDAAVTISQKYPECTGVATGFPYTQIIRQGQTSIGFSGMRPGPFHVSISYHGNNYDNDVDIHSGENSITVTVNN